MVVLRYEFVDGFFLKRAQYRESHLAYLNVLADEKLIVVGGVLKDAIPCGMIVLNTDDLSVAHKVALNDPYYLNKLISEFHVTEWTVVVGDYLRG